MRLHWIAVLQALFVAFLWATSWVFIKFGLHTIPPLTFAGLRYIFAFACLLLILLFSKSIREVKGLTGRVWARLILLGILFYAGTQGASFVALAYLPAVTVNLLWSFSTVAVALLGIVWLSEKPTAFQWGGTGLALLGAALYFYPVAIPKAQIVGVIVALAGISMNSISVILGRDINRSSTYHPLVVTVISMGAGSIVLLGTGLCVEGIPEIGFKGWSIIVWLAVVNTAFAFTLMNHTLRTLTAMESSMINSTMLIWIPIFAVVFLGESITVKEIIGLVLTSIGTLIVQMRYLPRVRKVAT
jgi:drug/metabolite transporter (DMT)-like permease